jgi:hypothetical protein
MVDLAHADRLQRAFASLLESLARRWLKQDVDCVSDEVAHGEYGDALENLVAIGLRNGKGFDPSQARQIEALAAAMQMTDSPFLTQPSDATRNRDAALPR